MRWTGLSASLICASLCAQIPPPRIPDPIVGPIVTPGPHGPIITPTPSIPPIDLGMIITAVVNGASLRETAAVPGLILTIFGSGLGPAPGVGARLTALGRIDNALAGVRVLFDGAPAPLLFAGPGQLNAVVPFALAGRQSTEVQIEYQGSRSRAVILPVADSAPAIFTLDASGKGPGAILNEDGTMNSSTNPARSGAVVVLYATGAGQTDPGGVDGTLAVPPLAKLRFPVAVTIGGIDAEVLYAGPAPGLVAGVTQANVRIPQALLQGGEVPILLKVGNVVSQPDVTVAVQRIE